MERRLAAILAADVVGYTALMGADEAGTLERLSRLRQDFLELLIAEHHGRVVKLMGDGILVEFASVVDAVACALAWQAGVAGRDGALKFRIGINLGDVIVEGEDIHGDGVNVASRLEGLAEPGAICLSGDAYRQAKGKVEASFEDLGEQTLKNVAEPVRVYQWVSDMPAAKRARRRSAPAKRALPLPVLAGGFALVVIMVGLLLWQGPWPLREEPASEAEMAFPLPDRPSIAVLPFNNMSNDPNQDYFADGMTEDLITDLSKISGLFVIARNSSFAYKETSLDIAQVAKELGVRYVLEGSVRRAGGQVRINAQLIDAATGGHVWAERYDGTLEDVFDLQDQVTRQIVIALSVSLTSNEQLNQGKATTRDPEAYDAYLRGWAHYRRNTHDDYAKARQYFQKALQIDPDYSAALAAMAATYWESYYRDWYTAMGLDRVSTRDRAEDYLELALVDPTPLAVQVSAKMMVWRGEFDEAIAEARKAIALDPNNADSRITLAEILIWSGRPREALELVDWARRIDPHNEAYHAYVEGLAEFALEDLQSAAASFERALDLNPAFRVPAVPLAVTFAQMGQADRARDVIRLYCEEADCHAAAAVSARFPFRRENDQERFVEGLVRAGLSG